MSPRRVPLRAAPAAASFAAPRNASFSAARPTPPAPFPPIRFDARYPIASPGSLDQPVPRIDIGRRSGWAAVPTSPASSMEEFFDHSPGWVRL